MTTPGPAAARPLPSLALALAVLAAACAEARTHPVILLEYEAMVPERFQAGPVTSSMRLAEFSVDAAGPGTAEIVVYYFGPGQGGSAEANIARWTGQFTSPDGGHVVPRVSSPSGTNFPTTVAEFEGTYARSVGMGPGTAEPDQALVAAVVETPRGNLFLQLFGDRAAVEAARDDFLRMATAIRPATTGD